MIYHTQHSSSLPALALNTPRQPVPLLQQVNPQLKAIQEELKQSMGHVITTATTPFLLKYLKHHETLKDVLVAPQRPKLKPKKHLKEFSRHNASLKVGQLVESVETNMAQMSKNVVFYGRECLNDYFCIKAMEAGLARHVAKKIREAKVNGDIRVDFARRSSRKKTTIIRDVHGVKKSRYCLRMARGEDKEAEVNRTCVNPGEQERLEVHFEILRLKMMLKGEQASHEQITLLSTSIKAHLESILHKVRLKAHVDRPRQAQKTTRCLVR